MEDRRARSTIDLVIGLEEDALVSCGGRVIPLLALSLIHGMFLPMLATLFKSMVSSAEASTIMEALVPSLAMGFASSSAEGGIIITSASRRGGEEAPPGPPLVAGVASATAGEAVGFLANIERGKVVCLSFDAPALALQDH
jgi:hypothetical protein